jgi:hypothetical protein
VKKKNINKFHKMTSVSGGTTTTDDVRVENFADLRISFSCVYDDDKRWKISKMSALMSTDKF